MVRTRPSMSVLLCKRVGTKKTGMKGATFMLVEIYRLVNLDLVNLSPDFYEVSLQLMTFVLLLVLGHCVIVQRVCVALSVANWQLPIP